MTAEASRRQSSGQKPFASRRTTGIVLRSSSRGAHQIRRVSRRLDAGDDFAMSLAAWMERVE
jgi:hypothetical protein